MKYYYCYSYFLYNYLKFEKNIRYIVTGKHIVTNKQFWQFEMSNELKLALSEWTSRNK